MSAQAPAYDPSAIVTRIPIVSGEPTAIVYSPNPLGSVPVFIPHNIEAQFRRLADEWIRDTRYISDPIQRILHPAHFKIIGMGPAALPLILAELQRRPAHWFVALDAISPENPVGPEAQNSFEDTARAWLEWGEKK